MTTRSINTFIVRFVSLTVLLTGCADTPDVVRAFLGKEIAEQRSVAGGGMCPHITTFAVSPVTVECGQSVALEIAATSPHPEHIGYRWEIEGQTFETGQKALWNTPNARNIGDPQRVYHVRGIATEGDCAATQSVDVKILCGSAFDLMVHFNFGEAHLDATAKALLDQFGKQLQASPNHTVLIEGHTDYIGSDRNNLALGKKRADAVRSYLFQMWHIEPSRVMTRSFGEDQPIAMNETDAGRAKNRRAEVFRLVFANK